MSDVIRSSCMIAVTRLPESFRMRLCVSGCFRPYAICCARLFTSDDRAFAAEAFSHASILRITLGDFQARCRRSIVRSLWRLYYCDAAISPFDEHILFFADIIYYAMSRWPLHIYTFSCDYADAWWLLPKMRATNTGRSAVGRAEMRTATLLAPISASTHAQASPPHTFTNVWMPTCLEDMGHLHTYHSRREPLITSGLLSVIAALYFSPWVVTIAFTRHLSFLYYFL